MKRLFILALAFGFISCSSDESNSEPEVVNPIENSNGTAKYFIWDSNVPNQYVLYQQIQNGTVYQHDERSNLQVQSGDKITVTCKIDSDGGMHGTYKFLNANHETIISGHLHSILTPSNHPFNNMGFFHFRTMADDEGQIIFTAP